MQEYRTFTFELEKIRNEILLNQISDVIIESTGVYWIALCSIPMARGINV